MSPADLEGRPVAILGWAGASERQLRSIVAFYRSLGAAPFTHRARVFRAMAFPNGWAKEGAALSARVRARIRRGEGPILIHLFSNAGFWSFAALLRTLPPELHSHLAGVVVDSAPGFPAHIAPRFYADHATKAMMPMVLRALGRPPALSNRWLTPPLWTFFRGWYHVSAPQQRQAEQSLRIVRDSDLPMLFLYSDVDALVPAALVESFIKSLAHPVSVERFEGSPHVAHMVRHRTRYLDVVRKFVT
ncbi:MAG: DUF829 domain-containing protein [Sandaracinaceae bacterium]